MLGAVIILLINLIFGCYFLYITYTQITHSQIYWSTLPDLASRQLISVTFQVEHAIHLITVNSGIALQIFTILLVLYITKDYWIKLQDRNFLPFLDGIIKYIGLQLALLFIVDSVVVIVAEPLYFSYFSLVFLAFSSLMITIILLDLLFSNFFKVIIQLKYTVIYLILVTVCSAAFRFSTNIITINLLLIAVFSLVNLTTHAILLQNIRRNNYVNN